MNIHQLMKEEFPPTISKFRCCFQMQRLLFVCQDLYFSKVGTDLRSVFSKYPHGCHWRGRVQNYPGGSRSSSGIWLWSGKSQQHNSKSIFTSARTANRLTKCLLLDELKHLFRFLCFHRLEGDTQLDQAPAVRCQSPPVCTLHNSMYLRWSPIRISDVLKWLKVAGSLTDFGTSPHTSTFAVQGSFEKPSNIV